jgi:hypothetical protein
MTMESRECSVCGLSFQFTRTVGRPPEKCGKECIRVSEGLRHRRYMRRLIEARDQLAALTAA